MGFGPINPGENEPVFHSEWEARVLANTLAIGALGEWNIDISRHARERTPTPIYLTSTYYQIWYRALTALLEEYGFASADEIDKGDAATPAKKLKRPILRADSVEAVLGAGGPVSREPQSEPAFMVGERIRTLNIHPAGHTRLPRYLRGHFGKISSIQGCHVFPDSNASDKGEDPRWLYSVRFDGTELWGEDHESNQSVYADMWEPYLERV